MRTSSKLFVLDQRGRLLLLDCVDPVDPATTWWELPGGGVEPGENAEQAGVREVAEETGVLVPPGCVGPLQWTRVSSFSWRGSRHAAQHEGRLALLPGPVSTGAVALTPAERGTILGQRWWPRDELAAHQGRFFPTGVPALLERLLAGEVVEEPDETWN